jgi:hypothetical protein
LVVRSLAHCTSMLMSTMLFSVNMTDCPEAGRIYPAANHYTGTDGLLFLSFVVCLRETNIPPGGINALGKTRPVTC